MPTASDFVPAATSGNRTHVDIDADADRVWRALVELPPDDLRVTGLLMSVRSVPALISRRGSLRSRPSTARSLVDTMATGRFVELSREPSRVLTLGVIGQFWKLSGGEDADIADPESFVAFDQPGFVKAAIDFVVDEHGSGTRLTTHTCNRATDPGTERRFRRYWWVIGAGSKLIRIDVLRAVRRRAEGRSP